MKKPIDLERVAPLASLPHNHRVNDSNTSPHIGTLAEKSLHAALKEWLLQPGDHQEVPVDGFVIDIVRGSELIEIQTRHLGAMKRKLARLLPNHPIHLYHPIAAEKWIVRETAVGQPISRRKSPKRGQFIDVFAELVRIPHLLTHPNLTITVLLTRQEEIWRDDGQGSWRRQRWSIYDYHLLEVVEQQSFNSADDWLVFLPGNLPQSFTNREIAASLKCKHNLAQKISYTLRHAGLIEIAGKQNNAHLYAINEQYLA
jgi:hypothetical protein